MVLIDTAFDCRSDASGRDPDKYSSTLRNYHRILWSKPLPSRHVFQLEDKWPGAYLHHLSELGEFFLSSDSVIPTFTRWKSLKHIIELFPEEENESFRRKGYSIGGTIVFPSNKIGGKQTINGARGFNTKIADRFDLTLECIRRFYLGRGSPLDTVLSRYGNFFMLFGSFAGYVDFFLLQDLVAQDYSTIDFFLPFHDFAGPSVPVSLESYVEYRRRSIAFVDARNRRIAQYAKRLEGAIQPAPTERM